VLDAWLDSLPDRYLAITAPQMIARHVRLSRGRSGPVAIDVVHRPARGVSELSVCADDSPGLLARIAGVLLSSRVDILSAQIATRRDRDRVEALDVFTVRDRYGRSITDEARWQTVATDLDAVLSDVRTVEELLESRRERSTLPPRVVPQVPTEVELDGAVSADFTVIDIYTQDRVGVLYTITNTLAQLALDIQLSKVATEAARVADIFYVREQGGGKLTPEREREVKAALEAALGGLP
jgi:[protein-PII] uridylyltransferase